MNERPIPEAALSDESSVEMLRVWIAAKGLHCSMKIGMYKESYKVPEENAWGTMLADIARHVATALHEGYGSDSGVSLDLIKAKFNAELSSPAPVMKGGFRETH
jgi:hypothetical protein